ncbi:hypothetical protein SeSPB_B0211, partial [Salmonella enterica subsp. enterica serovar Saintpaul str. SARA29]
FSGNKKDGKTKTAGGFTVSTDKRQIMLTEIRHSGQGYSSSGNASNDSLSDRERTCLLAI